MAVSMQRCVLQAKAFFREDLSAQLVMNSALTLNVSRHTDISEPLTIGMNCEGEGDATGSCSTQIDISEQLNALPRDTWSSMSIDLQCFVKEGIDFTGLVVPFEIGTKGKASVSVADIQFTPDSAEQAVISCQ